MVRLTLFRNSRSALVLPVVLVAHLLLTWWVMRLTSPYAQGSATVPPITVVLMQAPSTVVSASLTPLAAKFLQPESAKTTLPDSDTDRPAQRPSRQKTRVAPKETATTDAARTQQLPVGQESASSQPTGKAALVLPDFRDSYFKQRSAGDMANEQLNPNGKQDRLAQGIQRAGVPHCVDEKVGMGLLGIPVLIYKATSGKCK